MKSKVFSFFFLLFWSWAFYSLGEKAATKNITEQLASDAEIPGLCRQVLGQK